MTIMTPFYEKEAYDRGRQEGYDEGYKEGHLAANIQRMREQADTTRAGWMETMKEDYDRKIRKAYMQGKRESERASYETGYLAGKADGYQEGAAAGRRERLEKVMLPGEDAQHAAARVQGMEDGRAELARHLQEILSQVKEGSPVAAAIASRIESAINDFINNTI